MNCPASITKAKGIVRPSSRYAKEGTAAHTIAEAIIGGDLFPPPRITVEGDEFIVGLPMLRALNSYIDFVERLRDRPNTEWHCEKKVAVSHGGGLVWGTTDFASLWHGTVDIVDLKYGKGVPVKPDSPQLKIYALAAIQTLWRGLYVQDVNLTVVQPRIDPVPKTVTIVQWDLLKWYQDELIPAIDRVHAGSETENYGHWCRWCVRRNECKAFRDHKNSNASDVFDDGLDI